MLTDHKRTERKLRASEEVLREVVTLSGIGIFDHDHRSDQIYWSLEQRRNYGWNAEEPVSLSKFLECVYPDDKERVFAAVRRAHDPAGDGRFDIEHRIVRRDGAIRWLSTRSQTFFDGEGAAARPIRTIGAVIDITERVMSDQTLRASRAQLIQAQQMARIGSWELDLVSGRLDWSEEIFRIFEIDKERFGASYDAFLAKIHPEDRVAVDKAYTSSVENRTSYRITHRLLMADGRIKWVEEHGQTSYAAAGKPLLSSGTVQDVTERVETERAVRESEKRLAEAERIARVGHWLWEIPSNKLIWSEEMYRIYDREPGTPPLSDEQFYELVYPDDRASVLKAEKAALEGKNAIHLEFRAVLPDGTTRHLETRGNTEYDAAGAPIRMFGTTQDITELRHTEARLRLREAQLSAIFDSAPLMMSLKSRDGRFLRANPLVCSVFGFTEKDVLGKTSGELLGPEQGKFYGDLDQEVIATKSPKQYVDVVDLDGDTRHHLDVKFPVFDEDGEVAQIGLVSIDVTKRIEAERALRESRQRLAEAERIAHVGHWMAEIASGKLICSEGLYRIFGLEPDDRSPSAAWFYGMVHPEDQALVRKAEAAALARERPYHVEFRIVRADGAIRHLESRAEAECDAAGNLTRLFGVTQDITELRQTEAQLREAQKLEAIGRLTGGVAHDFNNLLGIIIGNLDLLAAELEPGSRRRTLIDRALKAAELGGSVTQHLLAFSRQQALQPQTVRPEALVQQAIPLLQRAVGDAIGLRMTMVDEPWICSVDPAQLETALINLAVNARDAMPEGGEIIIEIGTCSLGQAAAEQIGALSAGEYVTVSLRDTGTGMPPAVIARAFDPFFTTKEIGKGTGLGLSMVQGFCRQSGGDAAIESEVGRGTTVRLYLPRSRDAWDKPVPPRAEPSLPDQGETLLVVEDNPDLREYMFEALRSLGYQPVVAESGKEALTRLAEVPQIAAVVCDVVLSGPMSGFEFAREARRRRRDLQFLFVSGYADAANAGDVLRELEADFLPKPFRRNELGRLVQSALVRTRARVAREA